MYISKFKLKKGELILKANELASKNTPHKTTHAQCIKRIYLHKALKKKFEIEREREKKKRRVGKARVRYFQACGK